jgi:hypothetical protein
MSINAQCMIHSTDIEMYSYNQLNHNLIGEKIMGVARISWGHTGSSRVIFRKAKGYHLDRAMQVRSFSRLSGRGGWSF